jgi:predicted extracellular nuclease
VAFYNFENFFDTLDDPKKFDEDFTPGGAYHYNSKVYQQKLHNLATVLSKLASPSCSDGPALIGTAEIENDRVLADLVAQPEIRTRHYRFVHFESPDSRGIDVALIYHPKQFQVLQASALKTDISAYAEKGGNTRDVLYVVGILDGDTVHVFVNHWPSRRGGEEASTPLRMLAAGVSKRVIDSLMQINLQTRILLMGDLNDDPVNKSITIGLGATGNIRTLEKGGLFNPFYDFYRKGIGTLGYNDSWNLFDQIMLSSGFFHAENGKWHYDHAEIFNKDFLKETFGAFKGYPHRSFEGSVWINGFSDHFPVILYLSGKLPQ